MNSDKNLSDRALLTKALSCELILAVREAFSDMLETLQGGKHRALSARQRSWVEKEVEAHVPAYTNAYSAGLVARGNEITINCGPLVKRPPGRV